MDWFLWLSSTWPSSASEAGTSNISVPDAQHLGQGGIETTFLDYWAVRTVPERQTSQTTALAPRKGL